MFVRVIQYNAALYSIINISTHTSDTGKVEQDKRIEIKEGKGGIFGCNWSCNRSKTMGGYTM